MKKNLPSCDFFAGKIFIVNLRRGKSRRKRKRKRRLWKDYEEKICAALLAAALAALTGCGGSGEGNTADAEGDKADAGEITVYTALEDEQVTDYLAKFNETYSDIKVNVVRESTGIITAKLIAEKDNPQADVGLGYGGFLHDGSG